MKEEKRIDYIDIMRGILIISIVIGHVFNDGIIRKCLYSFHVPAFFFLSGFCFNCKNNFKEVVIKKCRTIIIPYIFFSVSSIIIFWIASKVMPSISQRFECNIIKNLIIMIYGNSKPDNMRYNLPLWFLPCLFTTTIIAGFIEALIKKKKGLKRVYIIPILIVIGGVFSVYETVALPWHLETSFSMLVWFQVGIMFREHHIEEKVKKCKYSFAWMIVLIIGMLFGLINSRALGVRNEHYGIIPIYYLSASLGIVGILGISITINYNKALEYIGRNSIVILGIHKFPILLFQEMVPLTKSLISKPDTIGGFFTGCIVTSIAVFISLVISALINRFTPFLIGKRNTN